MSDELAPLADPPDLDVAEWFRLVPRSGPAAALLAKEAREGQRCPGCGFLEPTPITFTVDRKLVPAWDLMDPLAGSELLCSEPFARALADAGASGCTVGLVPHATPNRVHGRAVYRLSVTGRVGPLFDTPADRGKQARRCGVCGRDTVLLPYPPVAFDASNATGDDVCWTTQWFGTARAPWRALMVRRRVVEELISRLPGPLTFGVEPVALDGEPRTRPPAAFEVPDAGAPADAPPLPATLRRIAADAARNGHRLFPPPDAAAVRRDLTAVGAAEVRPLAAVYTWSNGVSLFGGALDIANVGPGPGPIAKLNRQAPGWDYPSVDGAAFFAGSTYRELLWTVDAEGVVRGAGPDGITYGPSAPFAAWLADQVADLAYAAAHRAELSWAAEAVPARGADADA